MNYRQMLIGRFRDALYYRVACDCGDEECDATLELEKDGGIIWLRIYKQIGWYRNGYNWFEKTWEKTKAVFNIIFNNCLETQGEMVLKGEEHIDAFIEALEEGKRKLREE